VSEGFIKIESIDYEETLSSVERFTSFLLLALVAHLDLESFSIDIKTCFLNGNLKAKISMN